MKFLAVHPGASFSTHDVFVGLVQALEAQGHTIYPYQLDVRMTRVKSWLNLAWRRAGRPTERPTTADIIYRASFEALERALRFEVDWVLIVSGMFLHPATLHLMRRAGLRIAAVLTESPYDDGRQADLVQLTDIAWTNDRASLPRLRAVNPHVHYLKAAYNPEQHAYLDEVPPSNVPAHDVVFVGSGFPERIRLLERVDWTGIDFGLYGAWPNLGSRNHLRRYLAGSVLDNRLAVDLYRRAKIGLNLYRWAEDAESMNPRAYELAAVGTFQLSSNRRETREFFDWTVPVHTDPQELETQIRYFLNRPSERRQMADHARQRVHGQTFAARAAQMLAQMGATESLAKGA